MTRISDPHGGRNLTEWIGASPNSKPPQWVRDRVFARHKRRCHITGRKIRAGEAWELEHIKPLSMGGENRESNLAPALKEPHRKKTAREITNRAKADRIRRKDNGTWPKPIGNHRLPSRPFPPTRDFRQERR